MLFFLSLISYFFSGCVAFSGTRIFLNNQIKHSIRSSVSSNLKMATTTSLVDLSTVGNDIVVKPSTNGVVKIVMKFGGSSLESAGN
jgi:hypothetical protein